MAAGRSPLARARSSGTASNPKHQDSAGDETVPGERTALMTATVHPDLPPMFAGNLDLVPDPTRAQSTTGQPGRAENPSALGASRLRVGPVCLAGQIWAVNDGLET